MLVTIQDYSWTKQFDPPHEDDRIAPLHSSGFLDYHRQGFKGAGVKVGVLDTGITAEHPYFDNNTIVGMDFTDESSFSDGNGHGTHVAGTIAQIAPECDLYIAKCLNWEGRGMVQWMTEGLHWLADQGVHVVNMSASFPVDTLSAFDQRDFLNAVKRLEDEGIIFVVAAGNQGANPEVRWPAGLDYPIVVGSVTRDLDPSSFSSIAGEVDVCQFGEEIWSALNYKKDNKWGYAQSTGTSMATPIVTGEMTLLYDKEANLFGVVDEYELYKSLMRRSLDLEGFGRDEVTGVGLATLKSSYTEVSLDLVNYIGINKMNVNGALVDGDYEHEMDCSPAIINGRTMIPIRPLEECGASLSYKQWWEDTDFHQEVKLRM